ncbi:unnamed protein product [Cunninghamella blakesleeana]
MGINGLLSLTNSIQKPVHIKDYSGKRIAIDANVWLHIGAFTCAKELAMGEPTIRYVTYFMKQIDMLLYFKVEPVVVFDGNPIPMQNSSKLQRRKQQLEAHSKGMDHLRKGEIKKSIESFQKAVHITSQMINEVIKALIDKDVKYIRAPFDVEAQLAYLCKNKMVDAVITESSNLLVYGCPTTLFKLNHFGEAKEVKIADLRNIKELDLSILNFDQFQQMCILSGCDYLPSLKGVGLKVAYKLISTYKSIDKVFESLQFGKIHTNPEYEKQYKQVNDVFKYQYVYNPFDKKIVRMLPNDERLPHLGKIKMESTSSSPLTPPSSPPSSSKRKSSIFLDLNQLGKKRRA